MSKKKKHHEEHEEHVNHEAWVIPYADMLTLLMALFLVMWASSQVDVNKAREVAAGFADSLHIVGSGDGVGGKGVFDGGVQPDVKPDLLTGQALQALEESKLNAAAHAAALEQLEAVRQQIEQGAAAAGVANDVTFRNEERGLIVSVAAEGVLFDAGSAALRIDGLVVLDRLATVIAAIPNDVIVEGHTDNTPISTALFPSNWELSTARATAVTRHLVDQRGVPAQRITASGRGEHHPVADNATAEGRARNRRVDFVIVTEGLVVATSNTAAFDTDVAPASPFDTAPTSSNPTAHAPKEGSHE